MLRVLDSFAGAGGFSLGFSMTNKCEVVGAIEIDDWAAETFRFNHPQAKVLVGDIQSYSEEALLQEFQLVKPDIILGGPPCQGFSIANRKAGDPTDPRNSLFTEFIRLGKIFSPRIMVLENVPNIVRARTHSGELVISIIKKELEAIGYSVEHMVLNATDYGVPQIRRRLFVVANRGDISRAFPPSTHCIDDSNLHLYETKLKCPTLWDAISDLPDVEARGGTFPITRPRLIGRA